MTVQHFVIFDASSGRILRTGTTAVSPHEELTPDSTEQVLIVPAMINDAIAYVCNGEIVPRPALSLNALPANCRVTAEEMDLDLQIYLSVSETQSIEDLIGIPGRWTVCIRPPFPYQNYDGIVDVG